MWFKQKTSNLPVKGLLAAGGVVGYIFLIALFFANANNMFGKEDNFFSPIMALSLFVVSALICSLIVFAEPYRLFIDKRGDEALTLVIWTTKWLAVFVVVVMAGIIISR